MKEIKENKDLTILPRGGFIARTAAGLIQVGATPETIKDTMVIESEVPQVYLIPAQLFSFNYGISTADFEFPMYYNFFIKKRKTFLIGPKKDLEKIDLVLREALFGPKRIDVSNDYFEGKAALNRPRLKKEMNFFKYEPSLGRRIRMDDMVEYIPLHRGESLNYRGLEIINKDKKNYIIKDNGKDITLPKEFMFLPPEPEKAKKTFMPPLFGLTIIGSSHGFDPGEKTTGFIIWINRRGILVDPPVNSTGWLEKNGINPKSIGDLILTHCHADHDSGTLQKILEERRIRVHTTKTIMNSFLTKYSILTDIPYKILEKTFDFFPVMLGYPHAILGGRFLFKYSFHSIPTIWFETFFQDQSFTYSSDIFNHPPTIRELQEKNVMSRERAEEFLNFPWNNSIIIHEAGIPPIHTPIKFLEELDDKIKEKLYLIHISSKSIPEGKGLKLAKSGAENTLSCQVSALTENITRKKLEIISNVDLFYNLDLTKARNIIKRTYFETFEEGEHIIKVGDEGSKFYIICSGEVIIKVKNREIHTSGLYDYFGETALVCNTPRNADVYARSDVMLLVLEKEDLLELIGESRIISKARNLAMIREMESWELFSKSSLLRKASPTQKTELQALMKYYQFKKNRRLIKSGQKARQAYFISVGFVDIYRDNELIYEAGSGEIITKISFSRNYPHYDYDAFCRSDVELFKIDMPELNHLLNRNPGLKVQMVKLNPINNI